MEEYKLIRSRRKTISLEVREEGLIVRAPNRTTKKEADDFVRRHEAWIKKQREKLALRKAQKEQQKEPQKAPAPEFGVE